MLRLIDHMACLWLDWRMERAIAKYPELQDLRLHRASVGKSGWDIELSGSAVAVIADQTATMLEQGNVENYIQFDMLPRIDRGHRPIRVTVQWAHGKSPATKAAHLQEEVERLKAENYQLRDELAAQVL